MGVYAYLCDSLTSNFHPPKLMTKQIDAIWMQLDRIVLAPSSGGGSVSKACCHCGTQLHTSNIQCPWLSKSYAQAKKLAAKVLVNLARGSAAAATPIFGILCFIHSGGYSMDQVYSPPEETLRFCTPVCR